MEHIVCISNFTTRLTHTQPISRKLAFHLLSPNRLVHTPTCLKPLLPRLTSLQPLWLRSLSNSSNSELPSCRFPHSCCLLVFCSLSLSSQTLLSLLLIFKLLAQTYIFEESKKSALLLKIALVKCAILILNAMYIHIASYQHRPWMHIPLTSRWLYLANGTTYHQNWKERTSIRSKRMFWAFLGYKESIGISTPC